MIALRVFVATAAVATMTGAILVLIGLNPGSSLLERSGPHLAAGEDRRAQALLREGGPEALDAAAVASEASLRAAPYNTTALLRIAQIDVLTDGRLDDAGIAALVSSYQRVPFDRSVALWRVQFCLENWDRLPLGLRTSVQDEVFGVASEPGHVWPLRTRLGRITNRQGRVVAVLWHLRGVRAIKESSTR